MKFIKKLPDKQRLVIGKILLVIFFPVLLIIVFFSNAWESMKYFKDLLKADIKHELEYFKEYWSTKAEELV